MSRRIITVVMTALLVSLTYAAADEKRAKRFDESIEADRKRLLGEWIYPPLYRNGNPFVTLALRFADDGTGVLEYRFAEKAKKPRKKTFAYALTQVGDDRVIVAKGDAFPVGAVFTYRLIAEKVMFFRFAGLTVEELGKEPRNVAGSWFRPGVLEGKGAQPVRVGDARTSLVVPIAAGLTTKSQRGDSQTSSRRGVTLLR